MNFPITVTSIEHEGELGFRPYRYGTKPGAWVSVRPIDEDLKGRTYLGIMLGDIPIARDALFNEETGVLTMLVCMANPAIWVPDLKRVVMGCESWWGEITSPEELRQITDADIQDIWYVKALQDLESNTQLSEAIFGESKSMADSGPVPGVEEVLGQSMPRVEMPDTTLEQEFAWMHRMENPEDYRQDPVMIEKARDLDADRISAASPRGMELAEAAANAILDTLDREVESEVLPPVVEPFDDSNLPEQPVDPNPIATLADGMLQATVEYEQAEEPAADTTESEDIDGPADDSASDSGSDNNDDSSDD